MKKFLVCCLLASSISAFGQQSQVQPPVQNSTRLVRYSGTVATSAVGREVQVQVSIFLDRTGGSPLWTEFHTVAVNADGRYSLLLGSRTEGGIPQEIFSSESARWMSVLIENEPESVRSLLVSVPYALKAIEAERIGGRASADFITEADVVRIVRETLKSGNKRLAGSSDPEPASAPGPDSPATDFSDSNATEVLLVTQNGTGYGINAIALNSVAVRGLSAAPNLGAVQGENTAADGIGVAGVASSATGLSIGALGQSSSTTGRGIRGVALSATGATVGVQGVSNSPDGAGIQGDNQATTGIALGVRGVTNSSAGKALAGLALSATGASTAIDGQNASNAGTAIFANATSVSGNTFGLLARVNSPNGTAARFESTSAASTATLFSGISNNVQRFIVRGDGRVIATNVFTDGIAIEGNSTLTGDHFGYGVVGSTKSDKGAGVIGTTTASGNALSSGVQGYVTGTAGVGVWGEATNANGTPIGVYGVVNGLDAIGGVFENQNTSGKVARFVSNGNEVGYVDQTGFRGSGLNVTGPGDFDRLFVTNTSGFSFAINAAGANDTTGKGGIESQGGDGTAGDGGLGMRAIGGDAINAGQGGVGFHAFGGNALTNGPGGIGVLSLGGSGIGSNQGGIGVYATGGSNLTANGIGAPGVQAQGGEGTLLSGVGLYAVGGTNAAGVNAFGAGTAPGVIGTGGATNATGVRGVGGGSSGAGVRGEGAATGGSGVFGLGGASGGVGVFGASQSSATAGVFGFGFGSGTGVQGEGGTTSGTGVSGTGGAPNGLGVQGSGAGNGPGVWGFGGSSGGIGVRGSGGGSGAGVEGIGGVSNGVGVDATGGGNGVGVNATGGPSGGYGVEALGTNGFAGIHATGGNASGVGVQGLGGTGGTGVQGFGNGGGSGVHGIGGATGDGITGSSGASGGVGVRGTGVAAGATGILGTGGVSGIGVSGTGGTNGVGVVGVSSGGSGIGGSFRNSSIDSNQALIVRNATDTSTTFSVLSSGVVSAQTYFGDGSNLSNVQATTFNGVLAVANGGTALSTALDDRLMVGNGAIWQQKTLPDCNGSTQKLLYDTATNLFSCATEETSAVQRPNAKRWSYIAANGAGNFTAMGDVATITGNTGTLGPSSSTPASTQLATQSVANDFSSVNGNLVYSNSVNQILFQAKVAPGGTITTTRIWVAMTSATTAVLAASSLPITNIVGFRYDTSAGDSNWQCVTNDGGVGGTVIDSGIAASGSSFVEMQIVATTSSAVFSINGAQVCSTNLNLPILGTDFRYAATVTALAASARSTFVAWIYEESD